jgi:hypothetical protein
MGDIRVEILCQHDFAVRYTGTRCIYLTETRVTGECCEASRDGYLILNDEQGLVHRRCSSQGGLQHSIILLRQCLT